MQARGSHPLVSRAISIQIPYRNRFSSIWEYESAFLAGEIDFFSYLGPDCPICGCRDCYRPMRPYWRNAVELYPVFRKEGIPIARFLCRRKGLTFSLLPEQLIPYVQYTLDALVRTILLVLEHRRRGRCGFHGASLEVDPDSSVTPWLIACWVAVLLKGFRRAHPVLRARYDLSAIRTTGREDSRGTELQMYFRAFGAWPPPAGPEALLAVVRSYSRQSGGFLFGTPSQLRGPRSP